MKYAEKAGEKTAVGIKDAGKATGKAIADDSAGKRGRASVAHFPVVHFFWQLVPQPGNAILTSQGTNIPKGQAGSKKRPADGAAGPFAPNRSLFLFLAKPAESVAQSKAHAADSSQSADSAFPNTFRTHTQTWSAMVKRQKIRALVLYNRSGFFYVNGLPQGIYYEALRDFEQFVNQKLHTGRQHVEVSFIPLRPNQIEAALEAGVGDVIAYGVTVTPEREQRVAFSLPILTNVKQIVVSGKDFGSVSSLEDLSGKKSIRRPITDVLRQSGKGKRVAEKTREGADPDRESRQESDG